MLRRRPRAGAAAGDRLRDEVRSGIGQPHWNRRLPSDGHVAKCRRSKSSPKVPLPSVLPAKVVTRRTSSDFMLIEVGGQWTALREVNVVNGSKVNNGTSPLETAFDDSPASNTKRLNSMKADSTKYNIGDVLRESNLPTFALQVLRKDQVSHFSFDKAGNEKIDGIPVWRVRFREIAGPTLVSAKGGENLYSTGTLWINRKRAGFLRRNFGSRTVSRNPSSLQAWSSTTSRIKREIFLCRP